MPKICSKPNTVTADIQGDPPPRNPAAEPAAPAKYGKMADVRAKSLLTIAIKWAKAESDKEAKEVLTGIVRKLRDDHFSHLSQDSQNDLKAL